MTDQGSGTNVTNEEGGHEVSVSKSKRLGDVPHPASPNTPVDPESPAETAKEETIVHNVLYHNKQQQQHSDDHRTAFINDVPSNPFGDNTISTSKYTMWSFVPRSLFEQFRRIANVYFLFISALMLLGTYLPKLFESPLQAYSTLGPLCIVLIITMAKEGAEDYKRHKSDDEVNNRKCAVIQPDGTEKDVLWKDLRVGMIIRVSNKHEVPADVVCVQTSEPKSVCYVETSNIDGETNLKLKEALLPLADKCPNGAAEAGGLKGDIVYDLPNDRIHNFTGKMRLENEDYFPVGARNILLRGCSLRNTKWILGMIVYTGKETKVMKKSGGARSKMSQVEKTMNTCIKIVFLAQIVLCSLTTIAETIWKNNHEGETPYLLSSGLDLLMPQWAGNWFTFLLLFNNFIPISLYVTVEMVNYLQAGMIGTDMEMYDPETDTAARARTSNLNQDLGQIEYVFSDKTGTLTRNVMEFKQCSIAGKSFGKFVPEAQADEEERAAKQHGGEVAADDTEAAVMSGENPLYKGKAKKDDDAKPAKPVGKTSGFDDPALIGLLANGPYTGGYGAEWRSTGVAVTGGPPATVNGFSRADIIALESFFTCMAVCHTVVPETDENGGPPIYQAESPDEAALTYAARDVGIAFFGRQADHIVVRRTTGLGTNDLTFMTHGVHEFNSTRKRMSVVVTAPDGRYLLMCKGADNVMFDRSTVESSRGVLESHLTSFASTGLRTLVLCQRELSPQEFATWKAEFHAAAVSLQDREEKLAAVAEKYEVNMSVLGATAIEDRLQEGVPGTIRDLRRAGIKTWVLTGDKVETAINIGYSCRLLDPAMDLIPITAEDTPTLRTQLLKLEAQFKPLIENPESYLDKLLKPLRKLRDAAKPGFTIGADGTIHYGKSSSTAMSGTAKAMTNMAVVVTGQALSHIIGDKELETAFLTVAKCCKSVIACRVSPQQKATIVKIVRQSCTPKPLTLAIGDGANDVGMIQRAEVGVGISGREGLQAANAADFSISQFRFLKRLLLVHGRWDYRRMTKVVLYSFYKNVVITLSLFYFNALTSFSGTSFYESLIYSSYNFVLGLPIIIIGIVDRDISAKNALEHPSVYASGLYYMDLNVRQMLLWIIKAVCHSGIVFWLPYGCYSLIEGSWSSSGYGDGIGVIGFTTFSCLVWGMTFEVSVQTLTWTWLNVFFIAISLVGWYAFTIVYSLSTFSPEVYGVTLASLSRPSYYLLIILTLGAMILFDLSVSLLRSQFAPGPIDIAREIDAGYGTPGRNGIIKWGDEETEEDKMKAVAMLAAATASSGNTSNDKHENHQATDIPAKNFQGAGDAGVQPQPSTPATNHQPADTIIAEDKQQSTENTDGVIIAKKSKDDVVISPPPIPVKSISVDNEHVVPDNSAGTLPSEDKSKYVGTDGTIYVPHSSVLGDLDEEKRKELGIVHHMSHGFAYNYVSKRNMGELSVAPLDGDEKPITPDGLQSP